MGTLQFDSPSHIPDEKSVSLTTQTTRHSPLAVWIAWHETTYLASMPLLTQVFDYFQYANTEEGRHGGYTYVLLCAMRSQEIVSDKEL